MTTPRILCAVLTATLLAGCGSIAQLGVRNYTAKSGEQVSAGLVEPKGELACQKVAQQKHAWGWKGTSDRQAGILRITAEAVDAAPAMGANYVHVMPPSEKAILGYNINTFDDAEAAYYRCSGLTKVAAATTR